MEKKYKLTEETINVGDKTLYRIEALKDFSDVKKGEKGGFVENEKNLSQRGDCWVYENAKVYGNAQICGDAIVCEDAQIYGNVWVFDNAEIFGNAEVCGNAEIRGDAEIASNSDYIVFKNWWSSGRCCTWTKSNNMWKVGIFYGTGEELIEEAYEDSEKTGEEYRKFVKYVESIIVNGSI